MQEKNARRIYTRTKHIKRKVDWDEYKEKLIEDKNVLDAGNYFMKQMILRRSKRCYRNDLDN